MCVLRGRITINWQTLCPTPRTGAAGPALNSRAPLVVRNTSSARAGAAACSRSSARLSSARSPAGRCSATRPTGSGRSGAPRPRRRGRCRGWTSTCRSLSPHGRCDLLSGTHRLRLTVTHTPTLSQHHAPASRRDPCAGAARSGTLIRGEGAPAITLIHAGSGRGGRMHRRAPMADNTGEVLNSCMPRASIRQP